jgi:hypothetical protein
MIVTHILVKGEKVSVPNPYYSINSSNIEPEYIEEYKNTVVHFYNEKGLKDYIERAPSILNNKDYSFYKVEKLEPKVTVEVKIDV